MSVSLVESDLLFANPGVFMPHIKSGRLRPIAVANLKRISLFPDMPTFVEAGFPGFESDTWYGFVGPAAIPAALIARLNADIARILELPDVRVVLEQQGAQPAGGSPAEFQAFLQLEIGKWAKVIKAARVDPL